MTSGRSSAGAVVVRSRYRSSCSSAVTSSADEYEWVGAGIATDDRGCCSSCGDGGTNAAAADAIDSIVPTTTASDAATSDAGARVFIFEGTPVLEYSYLGQAGWQLRVEGTS